KDLRIELPDPIEERACEESRRDDEEAEVPALAVEPLREEDHRVRERRAEPEETGGAELGPGPIQADGEHAERGQGPERGDADVAPLEVRIRRVEHAERGDVEGGQCRRPPRE